MAVKDGRIEPLNSFPLPATRRTPDPDTERAKATSRADLKFEALQRWYSPGRVKWLLRSRGYLVVNQWPPDDSKISTPGKAKFRPEKVTPIDVLTDIDRAIGQLTGQEMDAVWAFVADCGGGGPLGDRWQARQERRQRRALPDPRGLGSIKGAALLLKKNDHLVKDWLNAGVKSMALHLGWMPNEEQV